MAKKRKPSKRTRQPGIGLASEAAPFPLAVVVADADKATVDMNFKVSPQMRAQVKIQAGARGMTTKAMIDLALREFWINHPVQVRIG